MLDGLDLHLHRRPHDIHNLYRQHHHQITQRGAEGLLPLLHQIKFQLVQWLLNLNHGLVLVTIYLSQRYGDLVQRLILVRM